MTRWAVWSDTGGFITDPMDDEGEALEALAAFSDEPEQVLSVLPICDHMRVETECERCEG